MVDTYVSDAYAARCEGSNPFLGTKIVTMIQRFESRMRSDPSHFEDERGGLRPEERPNPFLCTRYYTERLPFFFYFYYKKSFRLS